MSDFQGGNCYFAFCPLTSSSFPFLHPLVASRKPIPSHQHTFFSSYTPASLSHHYNRTTLHTSTLLLISPSFLSLFYCFLLGKRKGKSLSVCPIIICNILLLCLWKKLSKCHLAVLATSFTFYSNSCKTEYKKKKQKNKNNLSVGIWRCLLKY